MQHLFVTDGQTDKTDEVSSLKSPSHYGMYLPYRACVYVCAEGGSEG